MLRRGPLLANYYLYRCSASACATKIQVSHYTTNTPPNKEKDKENKDKEKQRNQPPKQVKDTPKAAPTTAPTVPAIKPPKTPKPTKPLNPNLPSPHTASLYENIHPVYEFSKAQEDKVLGIEDLVGHVSKNSYDNQKFNDTEKVGDVKKVAGNLKEKKFSLYGVFDGHQGKFAAEYVRERLPYELVATSEFAAGDYEAAIKKAYASVQKALLASKAYAPEQPKYDFTSGTTASIALITPTTTYLAQLGNTPILVKKNNAKVPSTLFPLPQPDDVERLSKSNMFLMYNYAPISDPKDKKTFWDEITKAKGDYLHGVSNINTLGSLGDSMYEPANLNRYLDALRAFHAAEPQRALAEPKRKAAKATQTNFMELSNAFVKFAHTHDAWKAIANHVAVADSRNEISWITNGLVDGTFKIPENAVSCSLRREPQVTAVPNEELQYVTIVTDGILLRQFQADPRAMRDIDRIVQSEAGKSRDVLGANFHNWFFGDNYTDDLSSVIISYQK